MLSSVLSSALHLPPKSLNPFSFHHLPISKNPFVICGFPSRTPLVGRLRVRDPKNMTELVRVDAFRGDDGTAAEGGRLQEAEAILGNGSVGIGRNIAWQQVESVLNQMSKWLVAGLFGLVLLWRHDVEALWAAMGAVVNSGLSITLKRILNHERPVSALRSDPGMPSSHAQSIFYAASYGVLALAHWLGMNVFTVTTGIVILISSSYLSWLRISQQLHTVSQVLVGAALGSMCGVTWFWMWHLFVLRAFISFVWVRIIVVLGSVALCVSFLIFVIQHWLMDEW